VEGNKLSFIIGVSMEEHTYNSEGLMTKYEYTGDGVVGIRWKLVSGGGDSLDSIILIPIIGGISVAVIAAVIIIYLKKFRKP
jgi:hypothetical protein